MFRTGQLVRGKVSRRYYRVVGCTRGGASWMLQDRRGNVYSVKPNSTTNFTLIGNNYKAKG